MKIGNPEVLLGGLVFPEAPRWHNEELWLSDIHAHQVLKLKPDGRKQVVAELDDRPSGLGFLPDGTPIVVCMRSQRILALDPKGPRLVADLTMFKGDFLNDMVVDAAGRAYVGLRVSVMYSGPEARNQYLMDDRESLVLVTPDGDMRIVATNLTAPNGCVITPDGKTLIVAETRAHRLRAFDIGPNGDLENPQIFADLGDSIADGICLDSDNAVWIGSPQEGEFKRVLEGGEVTDVVRISNRWAVACMLGGPDRRTLYMCTCENTMKNMQRLEETKIDSISTSKGYIEAVRVDVPGAGWP